MSHPQKKMPLLQPALAWIPVLCLMGVSLLCVLANLGSVLTLLFPAGTFVVAAFLYWRYPLMYVSFTLWIWFLAAFVRRLADYYGGGWTNPSPVLLAPLFATLVSGVTFWRALKNPNVGLPFLLGAFSVVYGFLVGLVLNPLQPAVLDFIGWISPIFFGFHLFIHWREYLAYRQTLQRTFMWGVVVMSGYGLVQYLVAPPWDQFWMENALTYEKLNSIGIPEPLGIRVFSTLNAPQPFAIVMMAGLLIVLSTPVKGQILATGLGVVATLLSLARSAWLSLVLGWLVLIPSLKQSLQIRLIGSLLVLTLLMVPVVQVEPFASTILPRLQGLGSGASDTSAQDRVEGYQRLLGQAFSSVPGQGLGFVIEDSSIGSRDSGLLDLWFKLGWLGSLPYLLGLGLLFVSLFSTTVSRFDLFASAARAIAVGAFFQIGFNVVTTAQFGLLLWAFLGIGLAARLYHTRQARSPVLAVASLPSDRTTSGQVMAHEFVGDIYPSGESYES